MQKRPLVAADVNRFVSVGDPQISPDGSEIVLVRQETCTDDNKAYSTLWLVAADGSNLRPLTHGKQNDRLPRWSPDGRRIAFISGRSERSKIWVLERCGGEAWELETGVTVNSAPIWAPDGRQIAFSARAFPHVETWAPYAGAPENDYQRAREQSEQALAGKKHKDDRVSDVKVITRLRHRMDGIGYYGDLRSQIFVVDLPQQPAEKTVCRQLTSGDCDHHNPSWSADGSVIYFAANRSPEADWQLKQDIWKISTTGGEPTPVLIWTGYISTITCSPDGKWIAFAGDDKRYGGSTSANLWLIPSSTSLQPGDARNLTAQLDRPVGHSPSSDVRYASGNQPVKWLDGQNIVFHYGNGGSTCIGRVNIEAGQTEVLWQDPLRTMSAFDVASNGELVMQISCPTRAEDLYLVRGTQELQLTDFNSSIYEACLMAPAERLTYSGDQGWQIDGWLLTPPDWDGKSALPTVLLIHGGPHGSYGSSFMFQAQIQATNGIAVFYTNPRGSQGYGQQFAYAVVGDWAGGDYNDLMLGIDHLVTKGVADESKLGIMGWSYGGFMTSWAITQTNRFQAALPGAIISNRHSFYGSSDIGFYFGEHQFDGNPWADTAKLLEKTAVSVANQVNTPVLFMHGENDLRCPIEQTDQFFTALRRQGKPAVMVRYPGEYHAINQPLHKEDRYQRVLAWFKHYLG